jgi:hypothetical protein
MLKVLKWFVVAVAGVVLLLVAVAMALQYWLRTDDFRTRVEQQASAALGVPLKLGRLSIDLWPLPAVAVDNVEIHTRPMLTVGRVEARPVYAALASGKLEVATFIVRKAVLPQSAIGAIGLAMQKKGSKAKAQPAPSSSSSSRGAMDLLPRRAIFDDITWVDEKGQRITVDAEADLGRDGLLDAASFKIVQGRLAGTHGKINREGQDWPLRVDIGGGSIAGRLQLRPAKGNVQVLSGTLTTQGVEVSALTAPSKPLTGKLEAQTTLRSEFREPGQVADLMNTQTRFTVRDALVQGIDLQKAVQTVGLSRGGLTRLDALSGQVSTQGKAVHLTNLVATSGALSATGDVSISTSQALSGVVNVDVSRTKGTLGVPLQVGGTVDEPSVMLTRGAMVGAALGTLVAPGPGTAAGAGVGGKLGESLRGLFSR